MTYNISVYEGGRLKNIGYYENSLSLGRYIPIYCLYILPRSRYGLMKYHYNINILLL